MDNISMANDLEKLLQEAKIRNEIEQNPVDAILLTILMKVYMDADPNNALIEFVDEYFPKANLKQMMAFLQAQLDFLAALKNIEKEIDQNTKSEP